MTDKRIKIICLKCRVQTNHDILHVERMQIEEFIDDISWGNVFKNYQIIQCCGCESMSFRLESGDGGFDDDGEPSIHEEVFPPRQKNRDKIKMKGLPPTVRQTYEETVSALDHSLPVLAGMGLRALVEAVCKEKKADGKSLFKQIDSLVDKQVLTPENAKILHRIRELGNKSAHEAASHRPRQIALGLTVIENMLKSVYLHPLELDNIFPKDENNKQFF